VESSKVYFQNQFETKNLIDFNDWLLTSDVGGWQITSGNASIEVSNSEKALTFLPNRSLEITPTNNEPVVLSINGIAAGLNDGGDEISFHARVKCLEAISAKVKILRLDSESFSEKFSVLPSERWTIVRGRPLEIPVSNKTSFFSIEITFSNHKGEKIFLGLPTAYLEYAFVRNTILRESVRLLPQIFVEIDFEQTDPTNPMLRLLEIGSAWAGYSEKLRQKFRYLDVETAKSKNLEGFKSGLVEPSVVEESFLPWLAQFTGIFLLGSRTATTAWGSLPSDWLSLMEVDDFTSQDSEIVSISRNSSGLVTAVVSTDNDLGLEVGDIVLVYGTSEFNVTPDEGGAVLTAVTNNFGTYTLQWLDTGPAVSESSGYVNFLEWNEIEEFGVATAGLFEYWRWQIETHYNGYKAGTIEAIEESAKYFLTGDKYCKVRTHVDESFSWDPRWNIRVETLVNETPGGLSGALSSPVVLDAMSKTKPAGFILNHYILPFPDYDENAYAYISFTNPPPAAGYAAGGNRNGSSDIVDKFAFVNDARSTLSVGLSSARQYVAGFASNISGYAAGGLTSITVDTIDKFAFSDDSRSTLPWGLSSARRELGAFASNVAGYTLGGRTPANASVDTVDKFAFSNDARTILPTGLSSVRIYMAGFASDLAGYSAGGFTESNVTTVDKFAFSNDARSTLATGLSSARSAVAGFESSSAGYVAGGGITGGYVTTVDKFVFSDDSRSTLATGLLSERGFLAGFASNISGYAVGGLSGAIPLDTVDKFAFSDDSRSTLAAGLSIGALNLAGFAG
jgi:hypothetical protein